MPPPADLQFELIDRFWCIVLRQVSGKNENQWAHKRPAFPKACAPAFGLALQTAIVAGVSFYCELMYDSQRAFLPISTMHIIVTQLLATIPSQFVEASATAGLASMFWLLPMSKQDCDEVFGMTKSFYDALPKLPDIAEASHPDVFSIFQGICDFAFLTH
jgi:hypothetical protein